MKRTAFVFAALCLSFGLSACSASLDVHEIPVPEKGATTPAPLPGVPFRLKRPHTMRVFKLQADKSYQQVASFHREFADTSRLFALNVHGAPLSEHTIEFALNEDLTIKKVDLTTASKLDEGLAALGKETKEIASALEESAKKREAREDADRKAESDARKQAEGDRRNNEDAYLAAISARHQVEALEAQLQQIEDGILVGDPDAIRRQITEAKLSADIKYRRAGLTPPYGTLP